MYLLKKDGPLLRMMSVLRTSKKNRRKNHERDY